MYTYMALFIFKLKVDFCFVKIMLRLDMVPCSAFLPSETTAQADCGPPLGMVEPNPFRPCLVLKSENFSEL